MFLTKTDKARDRASMLVAAEAMLAAIGLAAGEERAEAIRSRIEKLLPADALH